MDTLSQTNPRFSSRPAALITGASSGIGAELARQLAKHGFAVILVARRQDMLAGLASEIRAQGGQASIYAADLAVEAERCQLVSTLENQPPEILINNAGIGWYGYFNSMSWDTAQQMLAVNLDAVVHLTRRLLPGMLLRGHGHIINIGSIAGDLPNQGIAMYAATKAFISAFSTSLYRELVGSGIQVSLARIGPVKTSFFETAAKQPGGLPIPAERFGVSAQQVAQRILRLLHHPRRVAYIPGFLRWVQWVEPLFGSVIDRLGPLLLRRQTID